MTNGVVRGAGFVGRVDAVTRLSAVLDRAVAGRSVLIVLSGEAGIGKTTLLNRLVEQAEMRGATSAWATCWHAGQAPGFWPWVQVVRHLTDETSREALETGLGPDELSLLGRLAPQLNTGSVPVAGEDRPDQGRHGLFTGVSFLLDHAARLAPVVVVLDDLHWADASSLELLQFVARRPRSVPLDRPWRLPRRRACAWKCAGAACLPSCQGPPSTSASPGSSRPRWSCSYGSLPESRSLPAGRVMWPAAAAVIPCS